MSDVKLLKDQYNVEADQFAKISIDQLFLKNRTANCLLEAQYRTVKDVLNASWQELQKIEGFGYLSRTDLKEALLRFLDITGYAVKPSRTKSCYLVSEKVVNAIRQGETQSLDRNGLSAKDLEVVLQYEKTLSVLGTDVTRVLLDKPGWAADLKRILDDYICEQEREQHILDTISKIDAWKMSLPLGVALAFFRSDISVENLASEETVDSHVTVLEYIERHSFQHSSNAIERLFFQWLSTSAASLGQAFLQNVHKDERAYEIISQRAKGKTLQDVGTTFGVSRERIRQVEKKVIRTFTTWQRNNNFISLILFENYGKSVVPHDCLMEQLGEEGYLLSYLLVNSELGRKFKYNKTIKALVICSDEDFAAASLYVQNLPDIICEDEMYQVYNSSFEKDLVNVIFLSQYRHSGKIYHRLRLTLTTIYEKVLKSDYPEGLNVYDENELSILRQKIESRYGDIELPDGNRAISARLAEIGILCGRGMYKPKAKKYISDSLAHDIHDYIAKGSNSVCLMNVIYALFKNRLNEEGVNNKYYLQGILHELYGNEFYFKRDYVAKEEISVSVYSDITALIAASSTPISKQSIMQAFPGVTDIVIQLATSDYEVINLFGSYIHISKIKISDSEKEYLLNIIRKLTDSGNTIHCKDVFSVVDREDPILLKRNYIQFPFGLYSLLEALFHESFNFSRPYIANLNVEIERATEALFTLVEGSRCIDFSKIVRIAKENHYVIYSLLEFSQNYFGTHLLINNHQLASYEEIGITNEILHQVEEILFDEVDETMLIVDLPCIHKLPLLKYPWNEWLIYSIVYHWSQRLEVCVTNSQIRMAVPVIARRGLLDVKKYAGLLASESRQISTVDNLDDIDSLISEYLDDELMETMSETGV